MVRQWQEIFYGKRYSHSELASSNPDFVKMAECFGAIGYRAKTREELDVVLAKMMAEKRTAGVGGCVGRSGRKRLSHGARGRRDL
jgi:thiamine pyrophosphate-dependent acetolactate synthase large subunit-like protein